MERFIPIELLSYFALFGSASMKRGNDRINTEKLLSDEFWSFVQKWCGSEALMKTVLAEVGRPEETRTKTKQKHFLQDELGVKFQVIGAKL